MLLSDLWVYNFPSCVPLGKMAQTAANVQEEASVFRHAGVIRAVMGLKRRGNKPTIVLPLFCSSMHATSAPAWNVSQAPQIHGS